MLITNTPLASSSDVDSLPEGGANRSPFHRFSGRYSLDRTLILEGHHASLECPARPTAIDSSPNFYGPESEQRHKNNPIPPQPYPLTSKNYDLDQAILREISLIKERSTDYNSSKQTSCAKLACNQCVSANFVPTRCHLEDNSFPVNLPIIPTAGSSLSTTSPTDLKNPPREITLNLLITEKTPSPSKYKLFAEKLAIYIQGESKKITGLAAKEGPTQSIEFYSQTTTSTPSLSHRGGDVVSQRSKYCLDAALAETELPKPLSQRRSRVLPEKLNLAKINSLPPIPEDKLDLLIPTPDFMDGFYTPGTSSFLDYFSKDTSDSSHQSAYDLELVLRKEEKEISKKTIPKISQKYSPISHSDPLSPEIAIPASYVAKKRSTKMQSEIEQSSNFSIAMASPSNNLPAVIPPMRQPDNPTRGILKRSTSEKKKNVTFSASLEHPIYFMKENPTMRLLADSNILGDISSVEKVYPPFTPSNMIEKQLANVGFLHYSTALDNLKSYQLSLIPS
jgi:hypothetical protein